ncbi:hypothetical protein C1H76_8308 [Elsinoe australis]|uniref:Uncharacterized protein n=1 Tax=Elsinoe australis TaxID=40998 RepID=A0A4U7ANL2_9PEZI|nr:hypothetical protein C1H76_8308 [Elsinoe australis]
MFCLRIWVPLLFFLINVSPIYFILFVSATFYMQRPCLYCSILLTILVISLYDWRSNWFEPRNNIWDMYGDPEKEGRKSSFAEEVMNSTAGAAAHAVMEGVGRKLLGEDRVVLSGAQWLRELVGRREWRIPCVEVAIRL